MSRTFTLRQSFKQEDLPKLKSGGQIHGPIEEHYGVPWKLVVSHPANQIRVNLECLKSAGPEKWSIEAAIAIRYSAGRKITEIRDTVVFGNILESEEIVGCVSENPERWDSIAEGWSTDGIRIFEVSVKLQRMIGVYKQDLRDFGEAMKQFSDVVLEVKNQKFHVSKLFLATHSKNFEIMLLNENFEESKKKEINLAGVSSEDFQNFLEVLYGDDAIDEITVEGILLVADMFNTSIVVQKCEKFLMETSEKTLAKRFRMAIRYGLKDLKKKCNLEVKNVENIGEFLATL